jgi:hypothetical protein
MDFVAFIGKDEKNWGQIQGIINRIDCDKVILIQDKEVSGFSKTDKIDVVKVNSEKPLLELKEDMLKILRDKVGLYY